MGTTKCRKDTPKMENRDDQHMESVESILASLFGTIVDAFETVAKETQEADSSKQEDKEATETNSEKVINKEGQEEGNINIEERNMEKDNTEKEISTEESKNEGEWDIVESSDIKQTKKSLKNQKYLQNHKK